MIELCRISRPKPYLARIEFYYLGTAGHGLHQFSHDPAERARIWLMRPLSGTTAIRFDVALHDEDGRKLVHLEMTAKPEPLAILADELGFTVAHQNNPSPLLPVLRFRQ
jgi:hypothetical protein